MNHKSHNPQSISAEELDRLFDEGEEDVLQYFDLSQVKRPGVQRQVNSSKLTTQEVYRFLGDDSQNILRDCQVGQFRIAQSHYVLHISQDEWAVVAQ